MKLVDGNQIIGQYEAFAVEQVTSGEPRIVEFDDEGEPGTRAITAEEAATNYARAFGGKVKRAMCYYTDWEDAEV